MDASRVELALVTELALPAKAAPVGRHTTLNTLFLSLRFPTETANAASGDSNVPFAGFSPPDWDVRG